MNNKIAKKQRADILLFKQELCASREEAKKLILAGSVRIGKDYLIRKASDMLPGDTIFNIAAPLQYVSRGAFKLLPALDAHLPSLEGLIALDVGASTGGFTDLMLQRGATKVYTVDSGRGQLHSKLRNDPRVTCHEKENARYIDENFLPEKVDVITMDVSFISVTKILPAANTLLKPGGMAFILVKPQFEAGKSDVGKGGVVRDDSVRMKCVEKVRAFGEKDLNWKFKEIFSSPIKGPKGNQEYILVFES